MEGKNSELSAILGRIHTFHACLAGWDGGHGSIVSHPVMPSPCLSFFLRSLFCLGKFLELDILGVYDSLLAFFLFVFLSVFIKFFKNRRIIAL